MAIRLKRQDQFEVSNLAFGSLVGPGQDPMVPLSEKTDSAFFVFFSIFSAGNSTPLTEMEFRQKMREQKVFIIKYLVRALGIT
jgi:hypothetical protein